MTAGAAPPALPAVVSQFFGSDAALLLFGGLGGALPAMDFEQQMAAEWDVTRILVRDLDSSGFHCGVRGLGASADEVASALADLLAIAGASRVVAFGASSGGYAALLFGQLMQVDEVHVIVAQTTLALDDLAAMGDTRWAADLQRVADNGGLDPRYSDLRDVFAGHASGRTQSHLHFAADGSLDVAHARRLEQFPGVHLHEHARGGHALTRRMRDSGRLAVELSTALGIARAVPGQAPSPRRAAGPAGTIDVCILDEHDLDATLATLGGLADSGLAVASTTVVSPDPAPPACMLPRGTAWATAPGALATMYAELASRLDRGAAPTILLLRGGVLLRPGLDRDVAGRPGMGEIALLRMQLQAPGAGPAAPPPPPTTTSDVLLRPMTPWATLAERETLAATGGLDGNLAHYAVWEWLIRATAGTGRRIEAIATSAATVDARCHGRGATDALAERDRSDPDPRTRRLAWTRLDRRMHKAVIERHSELFGTSLQYVLPRLEVELQARDRERQPTAAETAPAGALRARTGNQAAAVADRPVVWLTGLSGAGKSTIAQLLERALRERGEGVEVLDGETLRETISKDLGFSKADRDVHVWRIAGLARRLSRGGATVVVAAISPYREARERARELIGERFVEVHVNASVQTCAQRDVKGHYARARAGEIDAFTGISDPYEHPLVPEVVAHTDTETPAQSAAKVLAFLDGRGTGQVG